MSFITPMRSTPSFSARAGAQASAVRTEVKVARRNMLSSLAGLVSLIVIGLAAQGSMSCRYRGGQNVVIDNNLCQADFRALVLSTKNGQECVGACNGRSA